MTCVRTVEVVINLKDVSFLEFRSRVVVYAKINREGRWLRLLLGR